MTTTESSPSYQGDLQVTRIVKRDGNGYFYVISVDATDEVYYRVWKGGMTSYLFAKVFKRLGRDIDGNKKSWHSVTKRSHLPATLGSAYDMIESTIQEDKDEREHAAYIKDMLKTKPENLKMIGQLEELQEGDADDDAVGHQAPHHLNGTSSNASSNWVGTSINSPGLASSPGPLATQPGSMVSFAPPPPSLSMGDEEVIKVDSDGKISFGDKMAMAIRQAAQNETQQGETKDEQE